MSHHDGSKPYQPRRGPERHPQPVEDVASSLPAVEQLAAAAAEAESMNNYIEQLQQQGHEQEVGEEDEEEEDEEMEEDEEDGAEGEGGVTGEHVPMNSEAAAAAASSGMQMDPHGTMMPTTVPPVSNQLTLSFQGEVYVFDSVSPDKVPLPFCRLLLSVNLLTLPVIYVIC
jgi:hypothetical protein